MAEPLGSRPRTSHRKPPTGKETSVGRSIVLLVLPSVLVVAAALGLSRWYRPTSIEIEVRAGEVEIEVGGKTPSVLFSEGLPLLGAGVDGFSSLRLVGEIVPEDGSEATGIEEISVTPGEGFAWSRVEFEPVGISERPLLLDGIEVSPGSVVTLSRLGDGLSVAADGTEVEALLSLPGELTVTAESCKIGSASLGEEPRDYVSLAVRPSRTRPVLVIAAQEAPLSLHLDLPPKTSGEAAGTRVPATSLSFGRLDSGGDFVSAIEVATVAFPGSPREDLALGAGDWLRIEPMDGFRLHSAQPAEGALLIRAGGRVRSIAAGPYDRLVSHDSTLLDRLVSHRLVGLATAVALWVFPTTLAGRRLWRELRNE